MTSQDTSIHETRVRYRVIGMDCASCASRIKNALGHVEVEDPQVSTATQILTFDASATSSDLDTIESAVTDLGYQLERIDAGQASTGTHITPAYQRALWIVILLNVGYGCIEMVGGFIAGSQALKADALDFLGDGLITFLGVLAIGWSLLWRAQSALIQGLFLGAMGLGVIGATIYRIFAQMPVEAGLMGTLAIIALIVNVAAALVLIPHRAGDANVRAVWLFSRNDAIGNLVVVGAAVLVASTGSSWPDLFTAFAIAGLFLHSSWIIVRDARNDIANASS